MTIEDRKANRDRVAAWLKNYQLPIGAPRLAGKSNASIPPMATAEEIPMLQKLDSFGRAMWVWAKAGFAIAPKEIQAQREAICQACEFWKGSKAIGLASCTKCGCTRLKLFMPGQSCPIRKWLACPPR